MKNESILNTQSCTTKDQNKRWNNLLDDYENYAKEYLLHYKKSLKGNSASASIYPYMKAKTEALAKKIYKAFGKSHLTEKQIKRMKKIHSKIIGTCC